VKHYAKQDAKMPCNNPEQLDTVFYWQSLRFYSIIALQTKNCLQFY